MEVLQYWNNIFQLLQQCSLFWNKILSFPFLRKVAITHFWKKIRIFWKKRDIWNKVRRINYTQGEKRQLGRENGALTLYVTAN